MLLYTHYINAPWRRPFAWKFSWFMTGFYSIFYNHPAHFCRGLVVAVVMPHYSAVTQLQRPFCSHAPSQKHRVTSLACSGKGGPAGLFCSLLVFFFFLSVSFFIVLGYSPSLFFFLWAFAPEIYTCCCWQNKKNTVHAGERAMLVIQVWCVVFQWGLGWLSIAAMDVAFGSGGASEGITRHLAQHLCHCDPPVGEAVRATAGGLTEKQHKFQRENQ